MTSAKKITYPYIPAGKLIAYVPVTDPYMQAAKTHAMKFSKDAVMPTGSVVVKSGEIVGRGANGSAYHETHECERIKRGVPTGQGYELCEGCHPKNHSEPKAINDALTKVTNLRDAALYLWGHWWCCEPCWNAITSAGIDRVFLLENSEDLFNKESPRNIIGKQFA